jgi:hypothetical protein
MRLDVRGLFFVECVVKFDSLLARSAATALVPKAWDQSDKTDRLEENKYREKIQPRLAGSPVVLPFGDEPPIEFASSRWCWSNGRHCSFHRVPHELYPQLRQFVLFFILKS